MTQHEELLALHSFSLSFHLRNRLDISALHLQAHMRHCTTAVGSHHFDTSLPAEQISLDDVAEATAAAFLRGDFGAGWEAQQLTIQLYKIEGTVLSKDREVPVILYLFSEQTKIAAKALQLNTTMNLSAIHAKGWPSDDAIERCLERRIK